MVPCLYSLTLTFCFSFSWNSCSRANLWGCLWKNCNGLLRLCPHSAPSIRWPIFSQWVPCFWFHFQMPPHTVSLSWGRLRRPVSCTLRYLVLPSAPFSAWLCWPRYDSSRATYQRPREPTNLRETIRHRRIDRRPSCLRCCRYWDNAIRPCPRHLMSYLRPASRSIVSA